MDIQPSTDWLDLKPDFEFAAFAPSSDTPQREQAKSLLRDFFEGIGSLISSFLPDRDITLWTRVLEKEHAEKMIGMCSDIIEDAWKTSTHTGKDELSEEFLAEVQKSIQASVEKAHGEKFTPAVESAFRNFRPAWERVVEQKRAEASFVDALKESGRVERNGQAWSITALPEAGKFGVRVSDLFTREQRVLDFSGTMAEARAEACSSALGSRSIDVRNERYDFLERLKSEGVVTRKDVTFQIVDDPGGKFGIRVTEGGKSTFSALVGTLPAAREQAATWAFKGKARALTRPLTLEKIRFDREGKAALTAEQFGGLSEKIEVLGKAGYKLTRENIHLDANKGIGGGMLFEAGRGEPVIVVRASGTRSAPSYTVMCGADEKGEVSEQTLSASAARTFSRLAPAAREVVDQVSLRYRVGDSDAIRTFGAEKLFKDSEIGKNEVEREDDAQHTERLKAEFGDDFADPSGPILASEVRDQTHDALASKTVPHSKRPVEMER